MPELDGRLWFDIIPWENGLMVRLYVIGPYTPTPRILEELRSFLEESNDVLLFAQRFPEDERILLKLQGILAGSTIRPVRVSGIHYGSDHVHSMHSVNVEI